MSTLSLRSLGNRSVDLNYQKTSELLARLSIQNQDVEKCLAAARDFVERQDTPQTFEETPSGGQAACLRPPPLIREEEKNQSRNAEEASKSKTTRVDSPTASVESHVSVESLTGSMIEFPSDPAWRRKYIALQHANTLEQDIRVDVAFKLSCLPEGKEKAAMSEMFAKKSQDFNEQVASLEKSHLDFFLSQLNVDRRMRDMTRVWIMTLEQIQAAFDIAQDFIDDPSAKGLMEACEKKLKSLREAERCDLALRMWDADEALAVEDLSPNVSEDDLAVFLGKHELELGSFLSSQEELIEFLDTTYGETLRQRQESMLLLKSALKAVTESASDILAEKQSEDLPANEKEELSKALMDASAAALSKVTSLARQRAVAFSKQTALEEALKHKLEESSWDMKSRDDLRYAILLQENKLMAVNDTLNCLTTSN